MDRATAAKKAIMAKFDQTVKPKNVSHLEVGDRVTRWLGGVIEQKMIVVRNSGEIVEVAPMDVVKTRDGVKRGGKLFGFNMTEEDLKTVPTWEFLASTGAEIDLEIGWDGVNQSGSFITEDK